MNARDSGWVGSLAVLAALVARWWLASHSSAEAFRGGVAIGDQIVDLAALSATGSLQDLAAQAARACAQPALNDFMASSATPRCR